MIVIYNRPGIAMVGIGCLVGLLAAFFAPEGYFHAATLVGLGVTCCMADIVYRIKLGERNLFHSRHGGQLYYIPVWALGLLAIYAGVSLAIPPKVPDVPPLHRQAPTSEGTSMSTQTLGLYTCHLSDKYRTGTNPFTGETVKFPLDDGLTLAERKRFKALLADMSASSPDPDGYWHVECDDGGRFNVSASGIDDDTPFVSCAVEVDGLTDGVASRILQLAQSANMVIRSSTDPKLVALTSEAQRGFVEGRWPGATVLSSPIQLRDWLTKVLWKSR